MEKVIIQRIEPAFTDERGTIRDLFDGAVRHVGLITSKKGSVRAQHYHKQQIQHTYVLSGKVELTTKDLSQKGSKPVTVVVTAGSMITLQPMVIHKYVALEDYAIIEITDIKRTQGDYESDTFRVEI